MYDIIFDSRSFLKCELIKLCLKRFEKILSELKAFYLKNKNIWTFNNSLKILLKCRDFDAKLKVRITKSFLSY